MKTAVLWFVIMTPTPECVERYNAKANELVTIQVPDGRGNMVPYSLPRRSVQPDPGEPKPRFDWRYSVKAPVVDDPDGCYQASVHPVPGKPAKMAPRILTGTVTTTKLAPR